MCFIRGHGRWLYANWNYPTEMADTSPIEWENQVTEKSWESPKLQPKFRSMDSSIRDIFLEIELGLGQR